MTLRKNKSVSTVFREWSGDAGECDGVPTSWDVPMGPEPKGEAQERNDAKSCLLRPPEEGT